MAQIQNAHLSTLLVGAWDCLSDRRLSSTAGHYDLGQCCNKTARATVISVQTFRLQADDIQGWDATFQSFRMPNYSVPVPYQHAVCPLLCNQKPSPDSRGKHMVSITFYGDCSGIIKTLGTFHVGKGFLLLSIYHNNMPYH